MAELIGFVSASGDERENAKSSNTIFGSTSPFLQNRTFTVSGSDRVKAKFREKDGSESIGERLHPVLVTSIGNLFIASLKGAFDTDGEMHEPTGDLNKKLESLRGKPEFSTDEQILAELVKFCKDHTMKVRRSKAFRTYGYTGHEKWKQIVDIDIVTED